MKEKSEDFYWAVGNRIRDTRIRSRISVEELAVRSGISPKHLYQIENGRVAFSTEILCHLAKELEASADVLLGIVEDERESSGRRRWSY